MVGTGCNILQVPAKKIHFRYRIQNITEYNYAINCIMQLTITHIDNIDID